MPKACPYVMMRFLFVLSYKLISEDWFFVEGEWFFMFLFFPQYLSIDPYFCADFLYSVGVMPVWALKCL